MNNTQVQGERHNAFYKDHVLIKNGLNAQFICFITLFRKEMRRFLKVGLQTIAAPVLIALLYVLVFRYVVKDHGAAYRFVSYTQFLIPGLIMMSILQNAFANSSSSLIQSKISGSLIFLLLAPLSYITIFAAYVLAAVVRGLFVGIGVWVATLWFVPFSFSAPLWIAIFAILSAGVLGSLGLIAGIWAEKFDQIATFQSFCIMPATFLAGVFYSIYSLPNTWQVISHLNPFFYMVDGFRYGFFGASDIAPMHSLIITGLTFVACSFSALCLLRSGYKIRH